jgi:hypothetical protein
VVPVAGEMKKLVVFIMILSLGAALAAAGYYLAVERPAHQKAPCPDMADEDPCYRFCENSCKDTPQPCLDACIASCD